MIFTTSRGELSFLEDRWVPTLTVTSPWDLGSRGSEDREIESQLIHDRLRRKWPLFPDSCGVLSAHRTLSLSD